LHRFTTLIANTSGQRSGAATIHAPGKPIGAAHSNGLSPNRLHAPDDSLKTGSTRLVHRVVNGSQVGFMLYHAPSPTPAAPATVAWTTPYMPPDFHEFLRCAASGLAIGLLLCAPTLVYRWLRGRPLIPAVVAPSCGHRLWMLVGAIVFPFFAWHALLQHKPTFSAGFALIAVVSLLLAIFLPRKAQTGERNNNTNSPPNTKHVNPKNTLI